MLHLILKSYTDEGFGRNVYKNVFFLSLYIYIYIFCHQIELQFMIKKTKAKSIYNNTTFYRQKKLND